MAGDNETFVAESRKRLAARAAMLAAFAAVIVLFMLAGGLPFGLGLLGFAVLLVAAAIIPLDETVAYPSTMGRSASGMADSTLQLFAEALPDPCLVLDRRSVVIHRNGAAAAQFAGVVPGSPIALALRAPAMLTAIDTVRRSGRPETVELHQTVPTETWHRVTVAPLVAGEGGGMLVVSMQSLTDEKRLDALRADFIANASHELRTPLTSVLGFIETLMGPAAKDPAAQANFLEIMRTHALRMSKLIEDLLSLSRIEMRQHVRPTASVDLGALLREVRDGLQAQAAEAGVVVNLDVPSEPQVVSGDPDELYEVFENLIDNALKYGADGGRVEVALSAVSNRQGYDYLVSVTDHGAGIDARHVPRLTERFYRVDEESSRNKKGTGLGLAIVKHIVTRHRGRLAITSEVGQGMRVEVLLPR